MSMGRTIAYLRDVFDISQRDLAKKIGMSKSVLNRVEQDSRPLRVDELVKIADYFDISADYMLGRKEVSNILFTQKNILQEDIDLVRAFHAAPENIKEIVLASLKSYMKKKDLSADEKWEFVHTFATKRMGLYCDRWNENTDGEPGNYVSLYMDSIHQMIQDIDSIYNEILSISSAPPDKQNELIEKFKDENFSFDKAMANGADYISDNMIVSKSKKTIAKWEKARGLDNLPPIEEEPAAKEG